MKNWITLAKKAVMVTTGLMIANKVCTNTKIDVIKTKGMTQLRCFLSPMYAAIYTNVLISELPVYSKNSFFDDRVMPEIKPSTERQASTIYTR